jgi:hypothetical protein
VEAAAPPTLRWLDGAVRHRPVPRCSLAGRLLPLGSFLVGMTGKLLVSQQSGILAPIAGSHCCVFIMALADSSSVCELCGGQLRLGLLKRSLASKSLDACVVTSLRLRWFHLTVCQSVVIWPSYLLLSLQFRTQPNLFWHWQESLCCQVYPRMIEAQVLCVVWAALAGSVSGASTALKLNRLMSLCLRPNVNATDEAHLLFSCPATAAVRRERRFAQLPFTSLQDLMCCREVYGVALFVHKCMKIADAAALAVARQQPR